MIRSLLLALALMTTQGHNALAAEVDTFSIASYGLSDSSEKMDEIFQEHFSKAVISANLPYMQSTRGRLHKNIRSKKITPHCDKSGLIRKLTNRMFFSFISDIQDNDDLEIARVGFSDSVYSDSGSSNPLALLSPFIILSPITRLIYDNWSYGFRYQDNLIGIDKIEHFFRMGKAYTWFNENFDESKIDDRLDAGEFTERHFFGYGTRTAMYSYADLAANFQGMRFWNHIFNEKLDPIENKDHREPFVKCVDKKWVIVKKPSLKNYIDSSFDESANCSKFKRDKDRKLFVEKVQELERENNLKLLCSRLSDEEKSQLKRKYGKYSKRLLNFESPADI